MILRLKFFSLEISIVLLGSDVEFDYDVVLVGNDLFISLVFLFKLLFKLFFGELFIIIGGLIVIFVNVIFLLNIRIINGKIVNFVFVIFIYSYDYG